MSQSENPAMKLDASIPANNYKIIEIYNKVKNNEWIVRPKFQRKLVWKRQHKINFIETILFNYPFPEIYIAPGEMNPDTLSYTDIVVDGQQRTTTIINYIEGKDIFSQNSRKIKAFKDLTDLEKRAFLNFEVSIRYLKNATEEQIQNIFQRINSSEYSLNQMELHHSQYGDSEFMLFSKQIVEKEEDIDMEIIDFKLNPDNRELLHKFFVQESKIFNSNDLDRMLALQYLLTLIATMIDEGEYFNRTTKNEQYLERFNGEFPDAYIYENRLTEIINFINSLELEANSIWFTKANMFTLIIEIYKFLIKNESLNNINKQTFKLKLSELERSYYEYLLDKTNYQEKSQGEILYFEGSRQGLNDLGPRENRGQLMRELIQESIN